MNRWVVLALALLLAGCNGPTTARVEPPVGTEWAVCPPTAARPLAIEFTVSEAHSDEGLGVGLHRPSPREFLWVYESETSTLREDNITRVNAVHVARDANGTLHVCTRLDVSMPIEVDAQPEPLVVAARIVAGSALPDGPLRVVVNWIGGCDCDVLPRGNATALFDG